MWVSSCCDGANERFTRAHTKAELFAEAMRRGLLIVPVSTVADVVHSGQLAARGYWTPVEHPEVGQTVAYPGPVARFSATPIIYHRRRTGAGQWIDSSQAEASMHLLGPALLDYMVNGRVQTRSGNFSAEHAPHGVYLCAGEDRWVAIACSTDEQWRALCAAAGRST